MALRERIRTGTGQIPIPDLVVQDKQGKINPAGLEQLKSSIQNLCRKVNGAISLGDGSAASWSGNVDGQYVTVLFPSVANTEVEIPHGLGRVVVGYAPVRKDRACDVYDSNSGSWNESRCLLKSTVANATVRLLLF